MWGGINPLTSTRNYATDEKFDIRSKYIKAGFILIVTKTDLVINNYKSQSKRKQCYLALKESNISNNKDRNGNI